MERLPHAALDADSRLPKAIKIHRLLDADAIEGELRLLEVGTGAGVIAAYFAGLQQPSYQVDAVDTVDQRTSKDGYAFTRVVDTRLPFVDYCFDRVISNHVIEHVGDGVAQQQHLDEIERVLKPGGRAYLAVPSRWQVIEPHYGLAWLSWLPPAWRTSYLRWRKRGEHYDCRPLSKSQIELMLARTGLVYRNVLPQALALFAAEQTGSLARLANALPSAMIRALAAFSPTHAYLLQRQETET